MKPAVDAAAVAKQGSKRSREERHDDEKRHEDEKRSKGAKSDVAADVKSSLARSKGPQEVNGALGGDPGGPRSWVLDLFRSFPLLCYSIGLGEFVWIDLVVGADVGDSQLHIVSRR